MKEEQFFFNGTNYSIKIGKNKTENDHLVRTLAKTDIWFHVNGAPHVFTLLRSAGEYAFIACSTFKHRETEQNP